MHILFQTSPILLICSRKTIFVSFFHNLFCIIGFCNYVKQTVLQFFILNYFVGCIPPISTLLVTMDIQANYV